jgi:hypothetical protein
MTATSPAPPPAARPSASEGSLRVLSPEKVVQTIEQLRRRIEERFPGSGLGRVAGELHRISRDSVARAERIRRPNWWLRLAVALLIALIVAVVASFASSIRVGDNVFEIDEFAQVVDSSLASLLVIGAAIAFLVGLEVRLKRRSALQAVRELRSLAHIVDMHQLTKDPDRIRPEHHATASSPERTYTAFQLVRYLDYCSELLSLISKVGAIYVQEFPDTVALQAVDQLATLSNDLSRGMMQKVMMVENLRKSLDAPKSVE